MAVAGERLGIGIRRYFTEEGQHPYDQVEWERRESRISDYRTGAVAFEQLGVEVPATWSMNATNILAQKYFRGTLGAPERESSLRQVIDRVVDTVTAWGVKDGYFVDAAEASTFSDELKHLIVEQKAAFNSPVWFNIGVKGVPQQASACQPYEALVSTPEGLVPIGQLVEDGAVGRKVFDARGVTQVVAVKANGRKHVLRITTKSGHQLDVTADHLVWRASGRGTGRFVEAGTLKVGDQLTWHRTDAWGDGEMSQRAVAEAALAGSTLSSAEHLYEAPLPVVAAYLRSLFQAEGYVSIRERGAAIGIDMISEGIIRGAQALLARFGIFSRVSFKQDRRSDRHGCFSLTIRSLGDRRTFADEIGFVDERKSAKLLESLEMAGRASQSSKRLEIASVDDLGETAVYDIQTESGEYLSAGLRVHNCFILAVEDKMSQILNWYVEEGTIFKGGSGAGVNLSRIRSSKEPLEGGGTASGPVSFMRGADASAGTIKSGGKTRRAAKMVILDVDHPDIQEFVWCKAREERKARVLSQAGFDMDLDGGDSHSIQYQNANNSVRVTDEFMEAVLADADWDLVARTTGETLERVKARQLFRQISEAAWECADPGMQYDTTINKWHTAPNTGRITASNPCFTGDMRVHTDKGFVSFVELVSRVNAGEQFAVYTHDATNPDQPDEVALLTSPEAVMITGFNDVVKLRFDNGMELRCTGGHKIFTANRGYVPASELTADDRVKVLDVPAPAVEADLALPVPAAPASSREPFGRNELLRFPEEWSEDFAHYLGWLIGDGSTSGSTTSTIYGSAEDRDEVLPRHAELLEWVNGDRPIKLSEQANGTAQLRLGRAAFKRFLESLGVRSVKGGEKVVPWSIEQAPEFVAASFLRGLFDADGCVRVDRQKGSYVGLGSISPELLRGVQRLLTTFGISSRIYREAATYDLRISSGSIRAFASSIGFSLSRKAGLLAELVSNEQHGFYDVDRTVRLAERVEDGYELTYNLSEPRNHSYVVNGVVVRNCSEYVHLDNSSCNLASLNLLRFTDADDRFDVDGFRAAVEVVFTAQEILVGNADYPTEKIGDTTRRFRELGLGYANLGALLMAQGLPYDSEQGRAVTAAITALMTGAAYETSARTAARMGPFAGFHENAEPMLNVLRMHRAEVATIDEELVPTELLSAAQESWDSAVELSEKYGVRNSQSTVLAPTGTISFLMDCDTTGIEPDLGLVKTKKLVGGGTMSIVNQTVPRALRRLGYDEAQVAEIIAYIDEHKTIVGAPDLRAEHMPVFACSMGDNVIHYLGHVKMMAAAQPFISGAISKCVTGETLLATEDGLVRIGSLHGGESPDSFRDTVIGISSLDGMQKTDAFYYGGPRRVLDVTLRSGHRITGTPNHRLLVATDGGLDWRRLDELGDGDAVATRYGAEVWSVLPARFDDFRPTPPYGGQKKVSIPAEMSDDLAFLLGAYASEGHTSRSVWTVVITNSVDEVLERVAKAARDCFGIKAAIRRPADRCASVEFSSKTVVEFLEYLGCGERASAKRIPDAVLRSPRQMVLAFLQGLALDAYTTTSARKWAICLDSSSLLDDLQSVLTNLGILHGRVSKFNPVIGKTYDEVYAAGPHAQALCELVPFLEPDKAARAAALSALTFSGSNTADVVPGISPAEAYEFVPYGRSSGGTLWRTEFNFLADARTSCVSRRTIERIARIPGVSLPAWIQQVLADNLHFSPVAEIRDGGTREVFDVSVPATHAFVGNGIVNHNTVNMPEDVTIDEVEQLHIDAWKMGLKAIAIYRDNCKVAQPLSTTKKEGAIVPTDLDPEVLEEIRSTVFAAKEAELNTRIAELEGALQQSHVTAPATTTRTRLPRRRRSNTFAFRVADCEGYVTVGEYEDGRPGEVFMKVSKQGSTLSGVMDAFSISVSLGLQHGVPLSTFVRKYTNMRFEPAGITDDAELRLASSLVDYIFRRLALDYLSFDERLELGVLSTGERTQPTLPGLERVDESPAVQKEREHFGEGGDASRSAGGSTPVAGPGGSSERRPQMESRDAPFCYACGNIMQRAGSCYACPSCGATSGCS